MYTLVMEARGVCAACAHEHDCIYKRESDGIPLECEQFQMSSPKPSFPEKAVSTRASSQNGHNSTELLGLCANCDIRATCTYPKPEGGVWRCEEYV